MKKTLQLILIIISLGCSSEHRSFNQEIRNDDMTLKLEKRSDKDNAFPGTVTMKTTEGVDTLCIADNIASVTLDKKAITLHFYGNPVLNGKTADVPAEKSGYTIAIDTAAKAN